MARNRTIAALRPMDSGREGAPPGRGAVFLRIRAADRVRCAAKSAILLVYRPISKGGRKVGEFTGDIELSADVLHDGSGTERFRCVMAERKHRHSKLVGRMVHDVFKLSRDQQVGAGGGSAALTCERADFVAIR